MRLRRRAFDTSWRAVVLALVATVVTAVFTLSPEASDANQTSTATPSPLVSSGGTSTYATANTWGTHSPLAFATRVPSEAAPSFTKPELKRPLTGASKSPSQSAPVQTITSITQTPTSRSTGLTASGAQAAGIGPLSSTLITHDSQFAFNGLDVAPPDTQLAAGPTSWLLAVNDMASIRSRSTGPSADFNLRAFFLVPAGFAISDPKVVYDAAKGRWYMSALIYDMNANSYVLLAVSTSSDPMANWIIYAILNQSTAGLLCDQPHLGFSDDKVTVACDNFSKAGFFQYCLYIVVDKAGLMSGTSPVAEFGYAFTAAATDHMSLQPVYSMTPTTTQFITYAWKGIHTGVIAVIGNPATRNIGWFDTTSNLPLIAMNLPPRTPQSGSTSTLDTGDMRFLGAVYSSGIIWMTAGDGCIPNGDTVMRACLRLVQVTVGGFPLWGLPTRTRDFDVTMNVLGSPKYLFYPAVTMDASGTTYVVYNMSSAADLPMVLVSDILPGATDVFDQTFRLTTGSAGAYTGPLNTAIGGSRWGDYSSAAPDPNDPHTVFVAGEISAFENMHANDWGTAGNTMTVPPCSSATIAAQPVTPQYPGPTVTVMASASGCWGTPQFRFWKLPPNGTWTIVQDYGPTSSYSWDTTKETVLGTYRFEVDARSQGFITSYDVVNSMAYDLASPATCPNTVTLTPPSPAGTGTAVLIKASSTCPDPVYRFFIQPPGGSWSVVQGFSPTSTYNWSATGTPGTYGIEVDVKNRLDPPSFNGFATNLTYTLQACSGAAIISNPTSPHESGGNVMVTGSTTCLGTPTYRFWVQAPGGLWTMKQDYSTSNTYNWPTTGLAGGPYGLEVDVRNQGAAAGYEATFNMPYVLTVTPCTTPTLSANPPSPSATGASVVFTAGTSACFNPQFRFWIQPPGGPWSVVQDYSGTNTYSWITTGTPGSYAVEVDVRALAEGSSVSYDAVKSIAYALNACSAGNLSAAPPSPSAPGGTIVLTGRATCPGTPTYRFWIQQPGAPWTIVQNYSTSNTYNWPTAGLPLGTYGLEVDIRNQGATASYETLGRLTYQLTVTPCATPTLTASPTSPGPTGATVTFTAGTSGCPNPRYRFWVRNPGGQWMILQDFSPTNTFAWSGTGLAGAYGIEVDVKDQAESVSYDAVQNITYQVNGCSSVTLTASPPNTAAHGSTVTLTATATCPATPTYRFWIKEPGGSWTVVQPYSTNKTFTWVTPATPGTYYLEVDVRDQGGTDTYEKVDSGTYSIT